MSPPEGGCEEDWLGEGLGEGDGEGEGLSGTIGDGVTVGIGVGVGIPSDPRAITGTSTIAARVAAQTAKNFDLKTALPLRRVIVILAL